MERKTPNGQVLMEFLVLLISFVCLYAVIRFNSDELERSVDLKKTKFYRWESGR